MLHPTPDRDWLPYASLEFPCAAETWDRLETALIDALSPLALPAKLHTRLLESAGASAVRIPDHTRQIRLEIFTSAARPALGQSWGFFHMIKEEVLKEISTRVIAFYLYVEGTPKPG